MDWEKKNKIRNELAQWLNKYDWDIYMTGTFDQANFMGYRDPIKVLKAHDRFVNDLTKNFNCPNIGYYVAVERHQIGGFCHTHSLLNGVEGLTYKQIGETWRERFGREKVEKYDRDKGANYYLTKYVLKDMFEWKVRLNKQNENYIRNSEKVSCEKQAGRTVERARACSHDVEG